MFGEQLFYAKRIQKETNIIKENMLVNAAEDFERDPRNTVLKCRLIIEIMVNKIFTDAGEKPKEILDANIRLDPNGKPTPATRIIKDRKIIEYMNYIKKVGNGGAHDKKNYEINSADAAPVFYNTLAVIYWYAEKYENNLNLKSKIDIEYNQFKTSFTANMGDKTNFNLSKKDLEAFSNKFNDSNETTFDETDDTLEWDYDQDEITNTSFTNEAFSQATSYFSSYSKVNRIDDDSTVGDGWKIRRVPINIIEKIKTIFEKPKNYKSIENQLYKHNVSIISNPEPVGKYSLTLYLLSNVSVVYGEDEETMWNNIYEFDTTSASSMKDLDNISLKGNSAYIIEEGLGDYDIRTLEHLSNRLKHLNSYLVIIERGILNKVDLRVNLYIHNEFEIISYTETLKQHILFYSDTEETYKEIIGSAKEEYFKIINDKVTYPYELNGIAELIVSNKGFSILGDDQSTKYIFPNRIKNDIETWFSEEKRTLDEVAAIFALSIYCDIEKDSFYTVLNAIKEMLRNILSLNEEELEMSESEAINDLFSKSTDRLLDAISAKVNTKVIDTIAGELYVKFISFKDENMGEYVLAYVLEQIPQVMLPLLEWLEKEGITNTYRMNKNLAITISKLLDYDFKAVINKLVIPYGKSNKKKAHYVIFKALLACKDDQQKVNYFWNICKEWLTARNVSLNRLSIMLMGEFFLYRYPKSVLNCYYSFYEDIKKRKLKDSLVIMLMNDMVRMIKNYLQLGNIKSNYIEYLILWLARWIYEDKYFSEIPINLFLNSLIYQHTDYETKNYVYTVFDAMKKSAKVHENVIYIFSNYILSNPAYRSKGIKIIDEWFIYSATNKNDAEFFTQYVNQLRKKLNRTALIKLNKEVAKKKLSNNTQHRRLSNLIEGGRNYD